MKESIIITKQLGEKEVRQYDLISAGSYQTNPIAFFQMLFSWKAKEISEVSSVYFSKALDTVPHKKQSVKLDEIGKGRGVAKSREVEVSLGR